MTTRTRRRSPWPACRSPRLRHTSARALPPTPAPRPCPASLALQGYRFDTRVDKSEIRISYAKTKERSSASRPPAAAQRTPVNAPSAGADFRDSFPREHSGGARDGGREREWQGERERSPEDHRRYSDHDDDRRGRRSSGGNRRDGREHDDAYRDEYEDSERGDEDSMFHRADQTGMNFD